MKGFTLLEVLVSVSILAIILASVYSAYTSNVESAQWADESRQAHQIARGVLERMSRDLEAACLDLPPGAEGVRLELIGEDRVSAEGDPVDRIDFAAFAHLDPAGAAHAPDLCEVGYLLEEDPDRESWILFRRDSVLPDDEPTEGGVLQEMSGSILGLDLRYQDFEGKMWDQWDTSAEDAPQAGHLPALVFVTLRVRTGEDRAWSFQTTVHPRLAFPPQETSEP